MTNSYDYPADPIDRTDLTGEWTDGDTWMVVGIVALAIVAVALTVSVVGSPGDVAVGAAEVGLTTELAASLEAEAALAAEAAEVAEVVPAVEEAAPLIERGIYVAFKVNGTWGNLFKSL